MKPIAAIAQTLTDFLGALCVLAGLAIQSRFNFKSSYWNWRMDTAFPAPTAPSSRLEKFRLAYEYAVWASRIRRLR